MLTLSISFAKFQAASGLPRVPQVLGLFTQKTNADGTLHSLDYRFFQIDFATYGIPSRVVPMPALLCLRWFSVWLPSSASL